jgi:flagellar hook-associated protein 1 FlgK
MGLSLAGAIATDSLGTISSQINTVSRNISGANTPGHTAKIAQIITGENGAARINGITRAANPALLKNLLQATSGQASSSAISDGLAQIEQFMNLSSVSASDISNSSSPAAFISRLTSSLQQYSASPSDRAVAEAVISSAKDLAQSLNSATNTTQQLRRYADEGIQTSVADINDILNRFRQVNSDVISGTAAGLDITDKLDQRDGLLSRLSAQIGVSTVVRPNNDMVIYTDSGVTLFETTPRTVSFQANPSLSAGATGNAVYIDGVQVTGNPSEPLNAHSGKLVGLTQFRDAIAPRFQNQLDEIARGVIVVFSESDQTGSSKPTLPGLFTYTGATTLPGANLIPGLAGRIVVNPNVDPTQGGDPTRLRDGGASSPGDPAYIYNGAGAAGYTERLRQIISAMSTPLAFDADAGLDTNASVTSYATSSLGWLASQRQNADKAETYQSAMFDQTSQALSNATGVNLDEQMSKMLALENSYQASAKLLAAINSMYSVLFESMRI